MARRKLPPPSDGSMREWLRNRLMAGEVIELPAAAMRLGKSEKQVRDAIVGLRRDGWAIATLGQQRYALEAAPDAEEPPAAPAPQKRRARPSPPAPKQRRRSAAERAQAAPPLGARLQVVGLGLVGKRVLVTLSDGTQEWAMTFDTAPPPAWAEEGEE